MQDDIKANGLSYAVADAFVKFAREARKPGALWIDVHALDMEWRRKRFEETEYLLSRIRPVMPPSVGKEGVK